MMPRALVQREAPQLSVVMCTYNRGELLEGAIRSVLEQVEGTPPYEILVVDNNSTDGTRNIVERVAARDSRVRYIFERQQGLSFARNTGVLHARAPLVAFTDDDVRAEPDLVAAIVRAFAAHPAADVVGGRVLPIWPRTPPVWLTRDHWAPLALVDHGDAPFEITADHPVCLVGANLAVRRAVFEAIGYFATDFQRVKDGIGSLEDHDFLLRLLRSGGKGLYDPRIVMHAEVQSDRLERSYHRRWHAGHGHFHALLRSEQVEQTSVGTFLGIPAHLYRQALRDAIGWIHALATLQWARAFQHELRCRFFVAFFRTRRQQFREQPRDERREKVRRLLRRAAPWRQMLTPAAISKARRTE